MNTEMLVTLIGSLGFPIVMCLILVFWFKKSLESLTEAVTDLKIIITKLCEHLNNEPH